MGVGTLVKSVEEVIDSLEERGTIAFRDKYQRSNLLSNRGAILNPYRRLNSHC